MRSAVAEPSSALARELLAHKADGRIKLYLTSRALAFRAAHPDLFARGDYLPLIAEGSAADHVVAFARRYEDEEVIVAVPRLVAGLTGKELIDPIGPEVWGGRAHCLAGGRPPGRYRDLFTGRDVRGSRSDAGSAIPLAELFSDFPVALLHRGG